MRDPSTPTGNNGQPRTRTRGAIRTHLGRKRIGPRTRPLQKDTLERLREVTEVSRHQQEDLFDRLANRVQELSREAGELSLSTLDKALDLACDGLVSAGEFTAENAERLRHFVRRDLLQRADPSILFRTGDITSAGTLVCAGCGWKVRLMSTTELPPCPQCTETSYRKEA